MTSQREDAAGRPQNKALPDGRPSTSDSTRDPDETTLDETAMAAAAGQEATVDVHAVLSDPAKRPHQSAAGDETAEFDTEDENGSIEVSSVEETLVETDDPASLLATVQVSWPGVSAENLDAGGISFDMTAADSAGRAGDGESASAESTHHDVTVKARVSDDSTVDEIPLFVAERSVVMRDVEASPGNSIARAEYELGPELGSGGIGVVYEARQTSINRSVAVKMLQEEDEAGPGRSGKFLEEAIITGELDHPNIVPIYDLGRATDGRLFYAMKQVRGTPWKRVLHTQEPEEKLRILLRACDAVAFAHSRGVVHRDLKPENIMLGEFGEVLVMDWGLALHRDRHNNSNSSLGGTPGFMAPEMVLGPISSIGPHSDIYLLGAILYQIITGHPPHTGQNQMACLLNAARNRIVKTDKSGELLDIALKSMSKAPTNRFHSVKDFQAAIRDYLSHEESLALEDIAREGAREAGESGDYMKFSEAVHGFENAIRLWDGNTDAYTGLSETRGLFARAARDKGDFDLGLSVLQPEGPDYDGLRAELKAGLAERDARAEKLRRAKVIRVGLVASLVIVMLISAVWINSARNAAEEQAEKASEQRDLAEKNHTQADRNFKLAKRAVDQMLTKSAAALEDEPGQHELRQELLRNAQELYATLVLDRPDDPDLQQEMGLAWHRLGEIHSALGEIDDATNAFSKAISILGELHQGRPDDELLRQQMARSYDALGENYRTLERNSDAEKQYDSALSLLNRLVRVDPDNREYHILLAQSLYNRGLIYYATNRVSEADEAFTQVLSDLEKLPLQDDTRQHLARAALNRGNINRDRIQTDEERLRIAREDYRLAISLLEELREASPRKSSYRLDLCKAHLAIGNLNLRDSRNRNIPQAEFHILKSEELVNGLVSDFDKVNEYRRQRVDVLNSLAGIYYFDGKTGQAASTWDRVRTDAQTLFDEQPEVPENQSQLGRALSNLGGAHNKLQDYEAAREVLVPARDHLRAVTTANPDNPDFKRYLRNALRSLTSACLGLGDHKAARQSALELVGLYPEASSELYKQSRELALCVACLAKDSTLNDAQLKSLRAEYVGDALRLLAQAARQAATNASTKFQKETVAAQKDFEAIREEPKFQELLELIDKL